MSRLKTFGLRVEPGQDGIEATRLDQVVAGAAGEGRAGVLRGFRIGEDVRPVGAAIDRRNADLGEPDRLSPRHPGGRPGLDAALALDMSVRPPRHQILGAVDPRLAVGPIGDRRATLRGAILGAGIVPVERLAGAEAALEIGAVVGARGLRRVAVIGPVAPVRQGRVVVDADRIDGRIGKKRIEGEAQGGAARADMGAVFGPIGGVDEANACPEPGADLGREAAQVIDGRVGTRRSAHPRQADELAAEDEAGEPCPRRCPAGGEAGIVPDHRPIAPWAGEEGRDLIGGRGRTVRAAGVIGRGIAGDAPAPGIGGLHRAGPVRVRQGVAGRHIHHHEGIEHDREAAAHQLRHQPPEPDIGRRAAISGCVAGAGDDVCRRAGQPGDGPGLPRRRLHRRIDPRHHRAVAGAQVVAEPARHDRHPREVRAERLKRIEGGDDVAGTLQLKTISRLCRPQSRILADGERVEAELGGAGDQAHRADPVR